MCTAAALRRHARQSLLSDIAPSAATLTGSPPGRGSDSFAMRAAGLVVRRASLSLSIVS